MSSNPPPQVNSNFVKNLDIKLNENQVDEIPELENFIEDGYLNNLYQNYKIFVKVDINEKMMTQLNTTILKKIISSIMVFSQDKFTNLWILMKTLKKKQLSEINLELLEDLNMSPEEIQNAFLTVFSQHLTELEMSINFMNEQIFRVFNQNICKLAPFLNCLTLWLKFENVKPIPEIVFLGDNLDYLSNLKELNIHFEFNGLSKDHLIAFFSKFNQLKNLESLELVFDKIEIPDEPLKVLFENITIDKLMKLKKLFISFTNIPLLNSECLNEFMAKLNETNLNDFGLEFSNFPSPKKEFLNFLQKADKNEKIEFLRLNFKNFIFSSEILLDIENFIPKFPIIKLLDLRMCKSNLINGDASFFSKIIDLENVKKLEYLRLILAWNAFTDEFGRKIFEDMKKLVSLKYLFLDMQQNWSGSQYLNDGLHVEVVNMLKCLVNLRSILLNFDGNELKRLNGVGYTKIEETIGNMKKDYNKIQNFKLMEKDEVFITGTTQDGPNYKCHLPYEYFFDEFYKTYKGKTIIRHIKIPASYELFELILQECDFQADYKLIDYEKVAKELKIKPLFKTVKVSLENPIYNPSITEVQTNRKYSADDFKRIFVDGNKVNYSFLFTKNKECKFLTPPAVVIDEEIKDIEEIKMLKSQDWKTIINLLENRQKLNIIAKTPIFLELLCQNELYLVNFSVLNFEKMMSDFNSDDYKSIALFLNQIFRTTLNVNMKSDIPALILSISKYCKYLTCESFAFLSFYAKKVNSIDKNDELSETQKTIHKQKIESLISLHLEENQYFSTRSCKESLLELIDNKWKLIKLRSPDYFYDNDIFVIETKKDRNFMKKSTIIQNSINEFYSNIREAIKDFELVSLDDFYGDFILTLFLNLPNLRDINVSNLNLGDKFCEGFNTFVAAEKKKTGHYRFINLEIMNNIRITNVGLKFLYVSYQIMRNYFKQECKEILPKLKAFAVLNAPKKKIRHIYSSPLKFFSKGKDKHEDRHEQTILGAPKIMKKIKRKKNINQIELIKKNTNMSESKAQSELSNDKVVIVVEKEKDRGKEIEDDEEEVEVTDDEATEKHIHDVISLREKEEKMKMEKMIEEEKQLQEKVSLELTKKNLDDTSETIILNEGLGAYIQFYIKGLSKPKRFFCYNCDSEVCKECHKLHHKFKDCQPDFIICPKPECQKVHHKDLADCKLENQEQVICRGFRQILEERKKNMSSMRWFKKNKKEGQSKCMNKFENCILQSFNCFIYLYFYALESSKKCIMAIRKQFEKCCIVSITNEKGDLIPKQGRCLAFLNCFFGDPDTIDDEVKEFKFNKNVIALNQSLGDKRLVLLYSINFIIYYFLVGFVPIYFKGENTVLWTSHYIYAGYAFMVFLFETYLTYFIIKKVNSGVGNKILKDFSLANYLLPLILSQIKKYDFYTDMVFIIANINENRDNIAIISGSFLAITTFMNLIMILSIFKVLWNLSFRKVCCFICNRLNQNRIIHPHSKNSTVPNNSTQEKFSTFMNVKKVDNDASNKNINLFCQISSLLELECIGNCLDKFSTKNAWFFPYFGGYYIPQQIVSSMLKFLFEDLPGFTIQVTVLSYYDREKGAISLTPIIVPTIISLLASVTTVLTAKASILKSEELKLLEQEKNDEPMKKGEGGEDKVTEKLEKIDNASVLDIEEKKNLILQE